jgi:hypothetical protein
VQYFGILIGLVFVLDDDGNVKQRHLEVRDLIPYLRRKDTSKKKRWYGKLLESHYIVSLLENYYIII